MVFENGQRLNKNDHRENNWNPNFKITFLTLTQNLKHFVELCLKPFFCFSLKISVQNSFICHFYNFWPLLQL